MQRHQRFAQFRLLSIALACAYTMPACDKLTGEKEVAAASPVATPAAAAPAAPSTSTTPAAPATPTTAAPVAAPTPAPVAAAPVAAPVAAPAAKVEVHELLDEKPAATGVMASADPSTIDASAAPRLGGDTTPHASLDQATWLALPGGRLVVASPPSWKVRTKGDVEGFVSADEKLGILATTFASKGEIVQKLDKIGELAKISKVEWKEPQTVKLGPDELTTSLRAGVATVADGSKVVVMFALIDTGATEKVMAVLLVDMAATKTDMEQAHAILKSIKRLRA